MEDTTVAAPAPPDATPATISATRDAANKGDFSAFDSAHTANRRGAPMPAVEAKTDPAAPVERTISKRQEDINTKIREAVERATADTNAEIARLKSQLATPAAPRREEPAPAAPVPPKTPEWKRFMAMPDAPKLADFESVEEHAIAAALFINETVHQERIAGDRARQTDESRAKFLTEHGQRYGERLQEAAKADPTIVTKINPAIMAARPLSGLDKGQPRTFANAVAETGLFSPNPAGLYVYLTDHPEEAAQIAALPSEEHALRALAQLDGRLNPGTPAVPAAPADPAPSPAASRAAVPSTITAAPPPPQTVTRAGSGTDPKAAALKNGDFETFHKLETAKKQAERAHA